MDTRVGARMPGVQGVILHPIARLLYIFRDFMAIADAVCCSCVSYGAARCRRQAPREEPTMVRLAVRGSGMKLMYRAGMIMVFGCSRPRTDFAV